MEDETMKIVLTILAWFLAVGLVAPFVAALDGDRIANACLRIARKIKRAFRAA